MKKIICLLLTLAMVCAFAACSSDVCELHVDENKDYVCDTCGTAIPKPCSHKDADDNGKCDICNAAYTDGCDNHVDANDDGKCDVEGCVANYDDGCDNHVDADDNGLCDVCETVFYDGCDIHVDKTDDGKCDICGADFDDGDEPYVCPGHIDKNDDGKCDRKKCGVDFEDGVEPCDHVDADDDYKCDTCGDVFSDGCDLHKDRDDNGRCDICNRKFTDGCDVHVDADDDYKCDICGVAFDDGCATHTDNDYDEVCDVCGVEAPHQYSDFCKNIANSEPTVITTLVSYSKQINGEDFGYVSYYKTVLTTDGFTFEYTRQRPATAEDDADSAVVTEEAKIVCRNNVFYIVDEEDNEMAVTAVPDFEYLNVKRALTLANLHDFSINRNRDELSKSGVDPSVAEDIFGIQIDDGKDINLSVKLNGTALYSVVFDYVTADDVVVSATTTYEYTPIAAE